MQDLPEITAQLKRSMLTPEQVLTEASALMDTVNSLQTQGTEHLELVQQLRVSVWTVN